MKYLWMSVHLAAIISLFLITGCATRQRCQGAGVGALTGATAGVLLDPHNRWRGAVIGGSLGATLGSTLTENSPYQQSSDYQQQNYTAQSALIGGSTGAAAGALLDHDNRWRGSLIGGTLGVIFGGTIGSINSEPSIPVLQP